MRRLQQRIGLDCQSMPTSHTTVRHAVSWGGRQYDHQDRTPPCTRHERRVDAGPQTQMGYGTANPDGTQSESLPSS
jgi:hypothetical protein